MRNILCFWICIGLLIPVVQARSPSRIDEVLVQFGDDPQWALPDWDDSGWQVKRWRDLQFHKQSLWLRIWIDLPELANTKPRGLYLAGLFSAEMFWDGQPMGAKGRPGHNLQSEIPGPMDTVLFMPPAHLTPGRHLLALRLTSYHQQEAVLRPVHQLSFGNFAHPQRIILHYYFPALTMLSVLLLAGLYFAGRFWKNPRERSLKWLALLCFIIAAQLLAESWRGMVAYSYDWHLTRLRVIAGCALLFGMGLIAYLGHRLSLPRWRWWLGLCCVLPFIFWRWMPGYDGKTQMTLAVFLLVGLGLTLRALQLRRQDSGMVLLGVAILTMAVFFSNSMFLDRYLYLGFGAFLVVLFSVEISALGRANTARLAAESARQRLELALIKKQIQPHFLMNTLTSLIEWFEEAPEVAVAMIEALAEVYRLLLEVADQRLIPLSKEIALCDAYLEVMGYRGDRKFQLQISGVTSGEQVPPAVLLTLLENALTHNNYGPNGADFQLQIKRIGKGELCFQLNSPLRSDVASCGDVKTVREGKGTAYIRAQLQEAFAQNWSFKNRSIAPDLWQAEILVKVGA